VGLIPFRSRLPPHYPSLGRRGEILDSGSDSRRGPPSWGWPADELPATDAHGRVVSDEEIRAIKRRHGLDDGESPLTGWLSSDPLDH
jgi:hypothetical protein